VIGAAGVLAVVFAALAPAQNPAINYPPLAAMARIQGEVQLRLGSDGVRVMSGHPLLIPAARDTLQKLAKFDGQEIEASFISS